jgi:hypothetical protein
VYLRDIVVVIAVANHPYMVGYILSDYIHYMRQAFDDYNETCQMVDGSAAIHLHNLGLLMLRGIQHRPVRAR